MTSRFFGKRDKLFVFPISGTGSDNNHAHPDTSIKLGRTVL